MSKKVVMEPYNFLNDFVLSDVSSSCIFLRWITARSKAFHY